MFRLLVISAILVVSKCHESSTDPQCFDSTKENLKFHLGTKTPYRFIVNRNDSVVTYPGNLTECFCYQIEYSAILLTRNRVII